MGIFSFGRNKDKEKESERESIRRQDEARRKMEAAVKRRREEEAAKAAAAPGTAGTAGGAAAGQPGATPVAGTAPAGETYTVQSGDTLSAISKRVYGDANRWQRIFDANRDQLDDPDLIHPGQVLAIPRDTTQV